MKRNVTITLDEKTALWARVEAARRDTSVSEFVGTLLEERMREDQLYDQAMADYLARGPVVLKTAGGYPSRAELHER